MVVKYSPSDRRVFFFFICMQEVRYILPIFRISVAGHDNPLETARVYTVCSHLCGTLGISHVFYVCGSDETRILDKLLKTFENIPYFFAKSSNRYVCPGRSVYVINNSCSITGPHNTSKITCVCIVLAPCNRHATRRN